MAGPSTAQCPTGNGVNPLMNIVCRTSARVEMTSFAARFAAERRSAGYAVVSLKACSGSAKRRWNKALKSSSVLPLRGANERSSNISSPTRNGIGR
jgi:hypothetical protein